MISFLFRVWFLGLAFHHARLRHHVLLQNLLELGVFLEKVHDRALKLVYFNVRLKEHLVICPGLPNKHLHHQFHLVH